VGEGVQPDLTSLSGFTTDIQCCGHGSRSR